MSMISAVSGAQSSSSEAILDALQAEFGSVLAERIFEAEAMDFLWAARVSERYVGSYGGLDQMGEEPDEELSRVAFLSSLQCAWHVGISLIDGEGRAVEMLWRRQFDAREAAERVFVRAR